MRCFYILLLTLVAAGLSNADLGEIEDFTVLSNTETTITVGWTLGASDQPTAKYTLIEDAFIITDVQCPVSPCQHTVEYLAPCSQHSFTITPFYIVNGAPVQTNSASLNGSTMGAAPDAPTKLVAIDHNHNADLSWTPPDNVACIDHWQVCYHLRGTVNKTCETTSSATYTTITLHGIEKCAEMIAEVRGITPDGVEGKLLSGGFEMGHGDPSEVRDLVVGKITNNTVELKWDDPITNPLCVDKYSIDYGPSSKRLGAALSHDNHATVSDLLGCTNYNFDVSPISKDGLQGTVLTVTAETLESSPDAPTALVAIPHNHNADLSWTPPDDIACVDHWQVCYHLKGTTNKTCITTLHIYSSITLHGLDKCAEMIVEIRGVTPDGVFGKLLSSGFKMGYGEPSAIRNLVVGKITNNTVELKWDDPITNYLCVDKYSIDYGPTYKRLGDVRTHDNHATISDLLGCTNYNFDVSPISTEGIQGDVLTVTAETLGC